MKILTNFQHNKLLAENRMRMLAPDAISVIFFLPDLHDSYTSFRFFVGRSPYFFLQA